MGKTKNDFLALQERALFPTYDSTFTKKDAISTGAKMTQIVFEEGEIDPLEYIANLARAAEVINTALKEAKERIPAEKSTHLGVTLTPTAGGKIYNFHEDPKWLEIEQNRKDREAILKVVSDTNKEQYDDDGVMIPIIDFTFRKSSISIKF